ncbi:hypothetical protein G6011_05397 [Alternaria panax]|uniref:Rhodopsin domain-containing protein n=1 Tax=Alternaria panax TaxID=48097 RepID=A0AAD4I881_9PLEO|nr:hypothetical protein G6011_05397 [Alternaria panax]
MKLPLAYISTRSTPNGGFERTDTVRIASWTILVITIIVFGARQIMKVVVFRKLAIDDLFILLAFSFGIGLSAIAVVLSFKSLGTVNPSSLDQTDLLMKGYYASEILYMAAIGFTKLSILVLFYNVVMMQRIIRRIVIAFGILILVWTIASVVTIAFQCELPRPWDMGSLQCSNARIFWIIYCIVDISTEVAIVVLSIYLVAYLQVRLSRKLAVIACFAPRMLVLSAALVRLILLYPATPHSDPQYRLWVPTIMSQGHSHSDTGFDHAVPATLFAISS